MTDLRQAAQQALEALQELDGLDTETECVTIDVGDVITALKAALEQQAEPPPEWLLVKNILDVFGLDAIAFVAKWQAAQQAEPVSVRMPRVGDKVICLEDESLGTVVSLTAGGSPDIKFDDGTRGTYMLREFAELFGYVAAQLDKTSFNVWWDSEYDDSENRFEKDSAAYWAWAGWQAAQRPWVGLTDEEIEAVVEQVANGKLVGRVQEFRIRFSRAIEAKLKERNI